MTEDFQTYWLIDGIRYNSEHTVTQKVLAGAIAIEISAEHQQAEAEARKAKARADAILDAKIKEAAAKREHEASAAGQREAALRFAAQNPGGYVSGGWNPLAELDEYGPEATNLLR